MTENWTVKYEPGRWLKGGEAQVAKIEDCEPYAMAVVSIPEIGWWRAFDDRREDPEAHLSIARKIAAAPDLQEAAELQEKADEVWSNCPDCQEALSFPELCENCFPLADEARTKRRLAIAKATGGPSCAYCGTLEGLRLQGSDEPVCKDCFKPRDDGPCFDDLPYVVLETTDG